MATNPMGRFPQIFRIWIINSAVIVLSVLFSLLCGEFALRFIDDKPTFAWRNWLKELTEDLSDMASYDSVLGWRMNAGFRSPSLNTGPLGLRFTSATAPRIAAGGIVAVGDSFTAGSEVSDLESWPAFLEGLLGRPVFNAGVGGWGTDQILLRGEQLIELLNPEILLVGFLASDIERAGYSIYGGGAKPYFRIEDGTLMHYNDPVPLPIDYRTDLTWYDRILSYSYIYHRLNIAFKPDRMVYFGGQHYETVDNDPVAVTCNLLRRVKSKADRYDVRMILVMQYGVGIIREFALPPLFVRAVIDCARRLDLEVVDEFPSLRAIAVRNIDDHNSHYVQQPTGNFGHMSAKGNRHVAELIATAIKNPTDGYTAQAYYDALQNATGRPKLGSGKSLLADTEELIGLVGLAFAELTVESGPAPGKAYLLKGVGGQSEHYLATGLIESKPGIHAFSIWIDSASTRLAVLQIHDRDGRGGIVSFDLATLSVDVFRLKNTEVQAWIDERRNAWVRVAVSIRAEQDAVQGIVQLVGRNWSRNFAPNGEAIRFSGLRLERLPNTDSNGLQPNTGPEAAKPPIHKWAK